MAAAAAAAAAASPSKAPPLVGYGDASLPGCEANLLRAVIALITADTSLALSGMLENLPEEQADGMGEYAIIKTVEEPEDVDFDTLKVSPGRSSSSHPFEAERKKLNLLLVRVLRVYTSATYPT